MEFKLGDRVRATNEITYIPATEADAYVMRDGDIGTVVEVLDAVDGSPLTYTVAFDNPRPWLHNRVTLGKEYNSRCFTFLSDCNPLAPVEGEDAWQSILDADTTQPNIKEETP